MRAFRLLAALLCVLLLCPPAYAADSDSVSVGYFHGSAAASSGYTSDDVPVELLTQINYAFARIDPDTGKLFLPHPERDLENLAALRQLRQENPDLRLLISAGGWDGSRHFSDTASTPERREIFAQSCLDMILEQDLDGIDIDWEYPVSGGPSGMVHRPEDKQNFTLLLQALRDKLDWQEAQTGREYFLTTACGDGDSFLQKIEPKPVAAVVDHIFLMEYDYCGSWSKRTEFNAPLNRVRSSVQDYIKAGVPEDKLVLGMPLYGRQFEGVSSANGGLHSTYQKTSSISYDEILQKYLSNPACTLYRDSTAASPYLLANGTFISYDDPTSVAVKAGMARDLDLAGIGFWEITQNRTGTLMRSALDTFTGSGGDGFSDLVPDTWYTEAVARVVAAGWMSGTAPRVFAPEAPVTRADFAAALYRMEDGAAGGSAHFSDIPADHDAAAATAWCGSNGIVNGFADGTFRPDASITREQMAAMLLRFIRYKGLDAGTGTSLSRFQDAGQVHAYAQEAMSWAVGTGLLQGRSGNMLVPGGTASRGETAVILSRFADSCLS